MAAMPAGWREWLDRRRSWPRGVLAFAVVLAAGLAAWAAARTPRDARARSPSTPPAASRSKAWAPGLLILAGHVTRTRTPAAVRFPARSSFVGEWAPAIALVSRCLQAATIAITLIPFFRSGRRSAVTCTGALLLAFLATGPVLSPQFLIWYLPFAMAAGGRAGRLVRPLFALACVLTVLIYPVFFQHTLLVRMPGLAVLNLRNAILVAIWAIAAFGDDGGRG